MGGVLSKKLKALLILITAFTLGHSLTLFIGSYNLFNIPAPWVEFLIPLTIVVTSAVNLRTPKAEYQKIRPIHFFMVLSFGFIHGMGFAGDLRSILSQSDSIFIPLLGMNLGLEIGQLIIVSAVWLLSYAFLYLVKWSEADIKKYLSFLALVGGLYFTLLHLPING
jgi:hypothetical protein